MAVAVFDFAQFVALYPEFAETNPAQATAQFDMAAALILDNAEDACIPASARVYLFYLLVAHALTIKARGDASMAGAITGASQGSVSVSVAAPPALGSKAYFGLTSYGLEYLALLEMQRPNFIYIEGPEAYVDSVYAHPWLP